MSTELDKKAFSFEHLLNKKKSFDFSLVAKLKSTVQIKKDEMEADWLYKQALILDIVRTDLGFIQTSKNNEPVRGFTTGYDYLHGYAAIYQKHATNSLYKFYDSVQKLLWELDYRNWQYFSGEDIRENAADPKYADFRKIYDEIVNKDLRNHVNYIYLSPDRSLTCYIFRGVDEYGGGYSTDVYFTFSGLANYTKIEINQLRKEESEDDKLFINKLTAFRKAIRKVHISEKGYMRPIDVNGKVALVYKIEAPQKGYKWKNASAYGTHYKQWDKLRYYNKYHTKGIDDAIYSKDEKIFDNWRYGWTLKMLDTVDISAVKNQPELTNIIYFIGISDVYNATYILITDEDTYNNIIKEKLISGNFEGIC